MSSRSSRESEGGRPPGPLPSSGPGEPVLVLVLANRPDPTAERLVAVLRRWSREPGVIGDPGFRVELVFPEELATATRFSHTLEGGCCRSEVRLADGRKFRDAELGVVVNRLLFAEVPQFHRGRPADREYATMEFFALLLSWFAGLPCRVLNPPSAQALHGQLLSTLGWQHLAARAGLPVPVLRVVTSPRRSSSSNPQPLRPIEGGVGFLGLDLPDVDPELGSDQPQFLGEHFRPNGCQALVLGDDVAGGVPSEIAAGCRQLARLSGHDILRIHFAELASTGHRVFAGAEAVPQVSSSAEVASLARLVVQSVLPIQSLHR